MPSTITLVGLGLGHRQDLTEAALTTLTHHHPIYLGAALPPGLAGLSARFHNLAERFPPADDPEARYQALAAELVRLAQTTGAIVFAGPGHPAIDEPIYPYLRQLAAAHHLPLQIIPGLSRLDATRVALGLDSTDPPQLVPASLVARRHHPPLDPDRPALITHCYQRLAQAVKETLQNTYPANFRLSLIQAAGSEAEQQWSCPLSELANQPNLTESTYLYLAADPQNSSFSTFQEVIAHLRAPEGCPWDREQTHHSLRPYLLEETYEVLEALDAADPANLAEELGDLLLQIVLHTQIAIDNGEFNMGQVIGHINRKMLRRHPHVFGPETVAGSAEVVSNWQVIKKAEQVAKGTLPAQASVLDGLPAALPALSQALAISQRVVRLGFEWADIEGVLAKLIEEAREISEATDPAHLEREVGDFLFSAVNLARWRNIDPESALRATNARFSRRFKRVESLAVAQGRTFSELSLAEMEALWLEAKRIEG
jgi:tetrapyrrole methylase family protein/MazG family protein